MRCAVVLGLVAACGEDSPAVSDASADPDAPQDALVCLPARPPDPDPVFEQLLVALDAQRIEQRIPGVAVGVLDRGAVRHTAMLGSREPFSCQPITPRTRFRLGPTMRVVDGIAVLAAAADGLIDLDAPVTTYIPELAIAGGDPSAITVRSLLDQTAGLHAPGFSDTCASQDLLGFWRTTTLAVEFAPGTAVGNWDEELSLLGAVLSAVHAKPFAQVIQERVFTPLGMTATFDKDVFLAGDHALGSRNGFAIFDPPECALWQPVEQVYVSLEDTIALHRYLATGQPALLSPKDLAVLHDVGADDPYVEHSKGYGMESMPYDADGGKRFYVDGSLRGTAAELAEFGDGYGLVYLANKQHAPAEITNAIIAGTSGHSFTSPYRPLPIARWSEYAGTWVDRLSEPDRVLAISFDGIALTGTFAGLPVTFEPLAEDSFLLGQLGHVERVRFWRDTSGVVQIMTSPFAGVGAAFHRVP